MRNGFNIPTDESFFTGLDCKFITFNIDHDLQIQSSHIQTLLSAILCQNAQLLGRSSKSCYVYKVQTEDGTLYVQLQKIKYSDLRTCMRMYEKIKTLHIEGLLKKSFKFIYFNKCWVLAIISQDYYTFTLEDIIKHLGNQPENSFPIEYIIQILVRSLQVYGKIKENNLLLSAIDLGSICFKKMTTEDREVELVFDFVNTNFLLQNANLQLIKEDFKACDKSFHNSLCMVVYSCLNSQPLQSSQLCANINPVENSPYIPGLSRILLSFWTAPEKQENKNILDSKLVKTWLYLLGLTSDPGVFSISAIYSAYYFQSPSLKNKATKILTQNLENSTKPSKIFLHSSVYKIFFSFLNTLPTITPELGLFLFKQMVLITSEKQRNSVNLIALALLLSKVSLEVMNDSVKRDVGRGIFHLVQSKTLTILHVLNKNRILFNLILKDDKELYNLLKLTSFLGPSAIDLIEELLKEKCIPLPINALSLIQSIPVQFKLRNTLRITQLLNEIFANHCWVEETLQFPVLMGFNVIYELLQAAKEAKTANFEANCYKNVYNYNVSPIMVKCCDCKMTLCVVCGSFHESSAHKIEYLTYMANTDMVCSSPFSHPSTFSDLPKPFPVFKDFDLLTKTENGKLVFYEGICCNGYDEGQILIDEFWDDHAYYYTEFYFTEITSENFEIEIRGSGIVVKNLSEEIVKNEALVGKFPRIGIFDTVGIGISYSKFVFFTYNGFHLHKNVKFCEDVVSVRVVFHDFKGEIIEIERKKEFLYTGECFDYLEKNFATNYLEIVKYYFLILKKLKIKTDSKPNIKNVIFHIKALFKEKEIIEIFKPDRNTKKLFKSCTMF